MNKKLLLTTFILLVISVVGVYAQGVKTIVTRRIELNDGDKVYEPGDSITVFAYKYKSYIHYCGIYSYDYAAIGYFSSLPFDLQPSQLKKLPDASTDEAKQLAQSKMVDIAKYMLVKTKEDALAGKFKKKVTSSFYHMTDNRKNLNINGDEVTVMGYLYENNLNRFALVYRGQADIYTSSNNPFGKKFVQYMPSVYDVDVKLEIERINKKYAEDKRAREEEERRLATIKKAHDDSIRAVKDSMQRMEDAKRFEELKKDASVLMANYRKMSPALFKVFGWYMDSAGGITVSLIVTNCSSQRIKYVTFRGYFLNAVGDKCYNEIGGGTEWRGKGIGPIDAFPKTPEDFLCGNESHIASYDFDNNAFYCRTADTFHLSSVTIEYMNGKKVVLSGAELKKRVVYE